MGPIRESSSAFTRTTCLPWQRPRAPRRRRLDRAGHFHNDVDSIAGGQYRRVIRQHRHPLRYRCLRFSSGLNAAPLLHVAFPKRTLAVFQCAVRDRHQTNSRHRRSELQRNGASRRAGSDHSDTDRSSLSSPLLQGSIYIHCRLLSRCIFKNYITPEIDYLLRIFFSLDLIPADQQVASYDPDRTQPWRPTAIERQTRDRCSGTHAPLLG